MPPSSPALRAVKPSELPFHPSFLQSDRIAFRVDWAKRNDIEKYHEMKDAMDLAAMIVSNAEFGATYAFSDGVSPIASFLHKNSSTREIVEFRGRMKDLMWKMVRNLPSIFFKHSFPSQAAVYDAAFISSTMILQVDGSLAAHGFYTEEMIPVDVYKPGHVLRHLPDPSSFVDHISTMFMQELALPTVDSFDQERRELRFLQPHRPQAFPLDPLRCCRSIQPLPLTQPNRWMLWVPSKPIVKQEEVHMGGMESEAGLLRDEQDWYWSNGFTSGGIWWPEHYFKTFVDVGREVGRA